MFSTACSSIRQPFLCLYVSTFVVVPLLLSWLRSRCITSTSASHALPASNRRRKELQGRKKSGGTSRSGLANRWKRCGVLLSTVQCSTAGYLIHVATTRHPRVCSGLGLDTGEQFRAWDSAKERTTKEASSPRKITTKRAGWRSVEHVAQDSTSQRRDQAPPRFSASCHVLFAVFAPLGQANITMHRSILTVVAWSARPCAICAVTLALILVAGTKPTRWDIENDTKREQSAWHAFRCG